MTDRELNKHCCNADDDKVANRPGTTSPGDNGCPIGRKDESDASGVGSGVDTEEKSVSEKNYSATTATSDKSVNNARSTGAHEGGGISVCGSSGSGCKGKGNECANGTNANEDNVANSAMTTSTGCSNRKDGPIGVNEESSASGCIIVSGQKGGMTDRGIHEQPGGAKEDNVTNSLVTQSSSGGNINVTPIGVNEGSNASDGGRGSGHKGGIVYGTTKDKPAGVESCSGRAMILDSNKKRPGLLSLRYHLTIPMMTRRSLVQETQVLMATKPMAVQPEQRKNLVQKGAEKIWEAKLKVYVAPWKTNLSVYMTT